ncbi:hypothetical protein BJY00DRAFT_296012 [Aspergillus carlsbadensis]|nr:hypothetical protein BJY00DRAFT_296012 [Aspergillus carlsbadensis]
MYNWRLACHLSRALPRTCCIPRCSLCSFPFCSPSPLTSHSWGSRTLRLPRQAISPLLFSSFLTTHSPSPVSVVVPRCLSTH